jgi:subtilisin family serine protease
MSNLRKSNGIGRIRAGVALALLGVLAVAYPSDEIGPAAKPKPRYAPGVLIVKFKEPVADELKAGLVRGEELQRVSTTPSLDALNAKYGLKDIRMLFRSFQVKDGDGRVVGVETMAEHVAKVRGEFPVRAERAPAEYRGPDLTTFFKLKTDEKANMEALAEEYRKDPQVEYASADYEVQLAWQPNDYFYRPNVPGSWGQPYPDLWGVRKIRCGEAWDLSKGSGVVIAVIDTGTWYRWDTGNQYYVGHPDIVGNLWINYYEYYGHPGYDDDGNGYIDDKYGYNFVDYSLDPEDSVCTDPMDFNGHGTHVAGTAAAVGNNTIGVIGVAPQAKIMTVKVLKRSGGGYDSWVADGIEYAASSGADVLNLSLEGPGKPYDVVDAIQYAYNCGCVIVAAAGNDRLNATYGCPANLARTITVSATDYQDNAASFTNYGTLVDVAAPGCDVLSTRSARDTHAQNFWVDDPYDPYHGSIYLRLSGTSMSAPHVAGTAALILSARPYLNPEEVRACIRKSAVDLPPSGFDDFAGFGRLDARAALDRACGWDICHLLITDPSDGAVFDRPEHGTIEVYGFADCDYWDYYYCPHCWELHYKPVYGATTWTWVNSGHDRKPWYYGGHVGTINVGDLPDGSICLRLTVYGYAGQASYDYKTVIVCTARHHIYYDPPDLPNWVKPGAAHPACGCPVIADLSTAYSGKEIFFGTQDVPVYDYIEGEWTEVWRPGFYRAVRNDGITLWQDVCNDYSSQGHTYYGTFAAPTCADLNTYYPLEEIVVPTEKGLEAPPYYRTLRIFAAGDQKQWECLICAHSSAFGAAASVADLETNPGQEVIVAHDGMVSCYTNDFSQTSWAVQVAGEEKLLSSTPVIANMDGDADLEVAVGTLADPDVGRVRVLKRLGGSWQIWRTFLVGNSVYSSPAAADLFSQWTDPKGVVRQTPGCEIVVSTGAGLAGDGKVYCLSPSAGLTAWSYAPGFGSEVFSSPAIADLDGDGDLEIVIGCDIHAGGGWVVCLHHNGTLKWQLTTRWRFSRSSPAIADLDPAHPGLEVAIMDLAGRLYILHGDDGTVHWCVDIPGYYGWYTNYSPVVGDVRPDVAGLEVVATMQDDYLYIFNIPGTQSGTMPWPMFHHDAMHTGRAP